MKVLVSNPIVSAGEVKENLAAMIELCKPYSEEDDPDFCPFDDASPNPSASFYRPAEALVLQSGKFDVEETLCVDFVRKWIKNGGRLVLIVGMWKATAQGFSESDARIVLENLEQSLEGIIFSGVDAIQFYCVPQMHAKLAARCDYDSLSKKYEVTKAIIGSTNLTSGALTGKNYELDLFFDRTCADDVAPLDSISLAINNQLRDFANGIGVDQAITSRIQKIFENWRHAQQERVAGYRNYNLPPDS